MALESDQQALVEDHMPLVVFIAKRFTANNSIELQTAISDGTLGLISAAKRYDSSHGKFSSYAYSRILGSMRDEQRARSKMRWDRKWEPPVFTSLDAMARNVNGIDAMDKLPAIVDHSESALDRLLSDEKNEAIRKAITYLTPREQQIITRHWLDKVSFNSVGVEIGLSESRVCQIAARALRRLRVQLTPLVVEA